MKSSELSMLAEAMRRHRNDAGPLDPREDYAPEIDNIGPLSFMSQVPGGPQASALAQALGAYTRGDAPSVGDSYAYHLQRNANALRQFASEAGTGWQMASALPNFLMGPKAQAGWAAGASASRGESPGDAALAAAMNGMPSQGPAGPTMAAVIEDPRIASAFTPRSRELMTDPPERVEGFMPMEEFRRRYIAQYRTLDGPESSRFKRSGETIPTGTWLIDDVPGIHGREVAYVADLPPEPIKISEHLPEREGDVVRYAEWNREGHRPPPINVVETDRGSYKVTDGHRRRRAAIASGTTVPAMISPTGPHPKGLAAYGETDPMRVGLTFEMLDAMRKKGGQP